MTIDRPNVDPLIGERSGVGPLTNPTRAMTGGFEATVVTAEIPATRGGPRYVADSDFGTARLVPAPIAVRIVVWFLFFVLVVALIGLAIEHYHPDWLSFLRNAATGSSLGRAQNVALHALEQWR